MQAGNVSHQSGTSGLSLRISLRRWESDSRITWLNSKHYSAMKPVNMQRSMKHPNQIHARTGFPLQRHAFIPSTINLHITIASLLSSLPHLIQALRKVTSPLALSRRRTRRTRLRSRSSTHIATCLNRTRRRRQRTHHPRTMRRQTGKRNALLHRRGIIAIGTDARLADAPQMAAVGLGEVRDAGRDAHVV